MQKKPAGSAKTGRLGCYTLRCDMFSIKQKIQVLLGVLMMGMPFVASAAETPPAKTATESIVLGMGCFWGAEKRLSEIPGVVHVEVGYAGGDAPKVDYQDVLNEER
ncbi:MAG TPA: peptide-methionine (S)-S-oxide reductase, partial [Halothiobacillus sp.]|nr:peptide-methionine (S)-S-oxide reductase [Halothiobacillus sp.]